MSSLKSGDSLKLAQLIILMMERKWPFDLKVTPVS